MTHIHILIRHQIKNSSISFLKQPPSCFHPAGGKIGKSGCGVNPLRGQNNVQGACDMGALPVNFSGYQKVTDEAAHKKFEEAWAFPDGIAPMQNGYEVTVMMNVLCDNPGELKWRKQ